MNIGTQTTFFTGAQVKQKLLDGQPASRNRALMPQFAQEEKEGWWDSFKRTASDYVKNEYNRPREEANQEAEKIVDSANQQAEDILDSARKEAEQIKQRAQNIATQTETEADKYAQEVRQMADEYAQKILQTTANERTKDSLIRLMGMECTSDLFGDRPEPMDEQG